MAEVLLFHHALGCTKGMHDFANALRSAGHTVHVPDLYDGNVFSTIEEGIAYAGQIGFETITERGEEAARALPREIVYAGFSLGVVPAQKLAQTREGALGALFISARLPASSFGSSWPENLPVHIHAMDADPFFNEDGDAEAASQIAGTAARGKLFLYPGRQHLFADSSLPAYDAAAGALLMKHALDFLGQLEA